MTLILNNNILQHIVIGYRPMKLRNIILICAAIALIPITSLTQILTDDDVTIYKDIVYTVADGHELKLDIAVPKYLKAPSPVIVDIPGGAWRVITKSAEDAAYYAKFGFIGVSITHRTSDIAIFPAAIHDCKTVIRWLRAHAQKYQIDPDKIGVTGFSSGGHLAVLLGTSGGDSYLEGEGGFPEYSSQVQAVVDHFGPTDFLKMNDTDLADKMDHFAADSPESLFLGGALKERADLARLANPIEYVDPKDPPTFIGHGEKDGMVIINQSELLYDALKKAGVATEFIRVKNADHMYRPYKWDAVVSPSVSEINEMTITWFQKWLGEPQLDMEAIPRRQTEPQTESFSETRLYYKLTIEIPGKTKNSYCKGRFMVFCGGETIAQGDIQMTDFSAPENRVFQQEFVITNMDLIGKDIMWNFRGEIYDSKFDESFTPMFMQGETYDPSIEGIGYHMQINDDKTFNIEKRVYRKE